MNGRIYLYGMVLLTQSLLLKGDFPKLDTYGEVERKYRVIGGETGTGAAVLTGLGCHCRLDGNFLGRLVDTPIREYFADKTADLSLMTSDHSFDGVEDLVIIDPETRTCFGQFGRYFSEPVHRWRMPQMEDVAGCRTAGIDPFFQDCSERAAEICHAKGIPYVTIDCLPDSKMHRLSAVNAVSNEFLSQRFPGEDRMELMNRYTEASDGLTIFTLGAKEILYGRKGQEIKSFRPYRVEVQSTLGAGDSFKAGCVYALDQGMTDEEIVSFASATAACALMKYPIPLNLPTLENVRRIQAGVTTLKELT